MKLSTSTLTRACTIAISILALQGCESSGHFVTSKNPTLGTGGGPEYVALGDLSNTNDSDQDSGNGNGDNNGGDGDSDGDGSNGGENGNGDGDGENGNGNGDGENGGENGDGDDEVMTDLELATETLELTSSLSNLALVIEGLHLIHPDAGTYDCEVSGSATLAEGTDYDWQFNACTVLSDSGEEVTYDGAVKTYCAPTGRTVNTGSLDCEAQLTEFKSTTAGRTYSYSGTMATLAKDGVVRTDAAGLTATTGDETVDVQTMTMTSDGNKLTSVDMRYEIGGEQLAVNSEGDFAQSQEGVVESGELVISGDRDLTISAEVGGNMLVTGDESSETIASAGLETMPAAMLKAKK